MSVKDWVDEAIDSYRGDDLQGVLIAADIWPEFLEETRLIPETEANGDVVVEYRELPCRCSVTPNKITLVTGY